MRYILNYVVMVFIVGAFAAALGNVIKVTLEASFANMLEGVHGVR